MSEEVKDETPTVEEPEKKPTDDTKQDEKTFTQADIDRILAERIAREHKKFSDYDELKTKVSDFEKQAEEKRIAELSEKEKAEELAKKAQEERDSLTKEIETMRSAVKTEKIRNAFITSATKNGIAYVDDAYQLADLSSVEVTEDGSINGIDDVVKSLIETKPYLSAKEKPSLIGSATNDSHDKSDKTSEQLLAKASEKARKSGRIEDKMAYAQLKRELGK
jgi:hypothetical protein